MPRLELCAALLLSRLYGKVLKGFHQNFNEVFLWSDSTIVLAWVKMSSNGLKIFVANLVTEIQNLTKGCTWRHVSSSENPADLLSRGFRPKEIVNRSLWWEGPKWLCDNPNTWPNLTCIVQELPELKVSVNIASTPSVEFPYNRFSNFNRLRRSVAWILRFKSNVMLPPDARASGPLSNQELLNAMKLIVHIVQKEFFHNELKQLRLKGVLEQNTELQRHSKWKVTKLNLQVGDLVLIMDDGASPTEWRRGRIVGLTKGSDGIPRVANIRTSTGVVSRNFTKLCILPVEQSVTSEVHC
nr:unnamed protein product [Callosobruchus chinensis]